MGSSSGDEEEWPGGHDEEVYEVVTSGRSWG
jgi:hypothetical protein